MSRIEFLRVLWLFALTCNPPGASAADAPTSDGDRMWSFSVPLLGVVDRTGCVAYNRTLEVLKVDRNNYIPLVIDFNSRRDSTSPHLGSGWSLPLCESMIVLKDANVFLMTLPDGQQRQLTRDSRDPNLLNGCDMSGRVRSNSISVNMREGWALLFVAGQLASLVTPEQKSLFFHYDDAHRITSIVVDGKELLSAKSIAGIGIESLTTPSGTFDLEFTQRPVVREIKGARVVCGNGLSLGSISRAKSGVSYGYEYSVSDQSNPTLTLRSEGARTLEWDPTTRRILRDGEISVDFKPGSNPNAFTLTRRCRGKFLDEKAFDARLGEYKETSADGRRLSLQTYLSGQFYGKIRTIETQEGQVTHRVKASYDEMGTLLRTIATDTKKSNITAQ